MRIETHEFRKQDGTIKVDVTFDDFVYVNATDQYQIFGKTKQAFGWFKDNTLIPYAEKLISLGKVKLDLPAGQTVTPEDLILVRQTGYVPSLRGTWLHPKLAIVFARWLDEEFAIWCDEMIAELLANGVVTLQLEDRKWVDLVEGLQDYKSGSAPYMLKVYKAILIHEQEGYNIRAFHDILDMIRYTTPKEEQPKTFKKTRELIKEMYENNELSRTSHEQMLELCTVTVVEVLEKQVRSLKSKVRLKRITLATPVVEVSKTNEPTIAELTIQQKEAADTLVRESTKVIDTEYLDCHRILDLDNTVRTEPIKIFLFDANNTVADCSALIKDAGLKVVFSSNMNAKAWDATEKAPHYVRVDTATNVKASVWFNDNGTASCSIQKIMKGSNSLNIYKQLDYIYMHSLTNVDPAFWTGSNKENTIRVAMRVGDPSQNSPTILMIYGYSSDKK